MNIVALIPAYNEAESIGGVIEALLAQTLVPDRIVVVPNGCRDDTAAIARQYPVTVLELPRLEHRKSEALNTAWGLYARDADVVVCLDADTVLPANAVADWEREMAADYATLGGSSSKFTMQGPGLLTRLQKAEFSTWTDTALRRGSTHVLAGTGCAINGEVLRLVAARNGEDMGEAGWTHRAKNSRDTVKKADMGTSESSGDTGSLGAGPWSYRSEVEDFRLTYRIRELGYRCQVSPTVRAYTDSMKTVKALWGQRMKWQVGTVDDLLTFGVNRLTLRDWWQQFFGMFNAFLKLLLIVVLVGNLLVYGGLYIMWVWWLFPVLFVALEVKRAMRIPHRDWRDVLIAASFVPNEVFMWLRSGWFVKSWWDVLVSRATGSSKDRWSAQYRAEGWEVV